MLKIITLVENTTSSSEYRCKHGLSLYIETAKHKILFDLGPDETFAINAKTMEIDISEIDTVIISHGHKDHGGALQHFFSLNNKAKVYIRKAAFEPHYIKVLGIPFCVGLDEKMMKHPQILFTDDCVEIDEELTIFSDVKTDAYYSQSNRVLYAKTEGQLVRDDFRHEQNLIITMDESRVLISGCSHAGIVNIQQKAESLISDTITTLVGGFHLYNPPTKKYESDELIDDIAGVLARKQSNYYTCHCTGVKAYERMKKTLGNQLGYLSVGTEIVL